MIQKGFTSPLLVISILIIIVAGVGGYAFWHYTKVNNGSMIEYAPGQGPYANVPPSPAPAATTVPSDWKTYRNEKYGFEVKYPEEWEISKRPQPEKTTVVGFVPKGDKHYYIIAIKIHDNPLNLSVWKYFDPTYFDDGGFQADPRAVEYKFPGKLNQFVLIQNVPSFIWEIEQDKFIVIPYKNKIYELVLLGGFNAQSVFNSMLPTFKFIQ